MIIGYNNYDLFFIYFIFLLLQFADEIQCMKRNCNRLLKTLNFKLNKPLDTERKAARKERYNRISQKYQSTYNTAHKMSV